MRALVIVLSLIVVGGCGSDVEGRRDAETSGDDADVSAETEVADADASTSAETEVEDTSTSAETEVEDSSTSIEIAIEDTSTSIEIENEDTSSSIEIENEDTSTSIEIENEDTSIEIEIEIEDTSTSIEDTSIETENDDTSSSIEDASIETENDDTSSSIETDTDDTSAETEGDDASPDSDDAAIADTDQDAGVSDAVDDEVVVRAPTCRVSGPLTATAYGDETLDVEVRIVVPGVTDLTTGNDPDGDVMVQLGVEASGAVAWAVTAAPIVGWQADDPPDEDAWEGTLPAPDTTGAHLVRARLTADAGQRWITCDERVDLDVVPDPCVTTPCVLPGPTCDGNARVAYPGPASCARAPAAIGTRTCDVGLATRRDCDETFQLCKDGSCVARARWCRLQHPPAVSLYPDEAVTTYVRLFVEGVTPGAPVPSPLRVELGHVPIAPEPIVTWTAATPNPGWTGDPEPTNLEWMASLEAPDEIGSYLYFHRVSIDGGQSWLLCDTDGGPGKDGSEDGFQIERAGKLAVVADPCAQAIALCTDPSDGCDGTTLVVHEARPICRRPNDHTSPPTCDYGTPTRTDCDAADASCDAALLQCVELPRQASCHLQWPLVATHYGDEGFDAYVRVAIEDLTSLTSGYDPDPDVRVEARLDDVWMAAVPNLLYVASDEPDSDEWMIRFEVPDVAGASTFDFRLSVDGGTSWLGCEGEGALTVVDDPCADVSACTTPPDRCEGDALLVHEAAPVCLRPVAGSGLAATCAWGEPTTRDCAADTLVCDASALACVHAVPACWLQWPPTAELYPEESMTAYARVVLPGVTDASSMTDVDADLEIELGLGPVDGDPSTWTSWSAAVANIGWDGALVDPPALDVDEYQAVLHGGLAGDTAFGFRVRWLGDGDGAWVSCDGVGRLTRLPDPCAPNPCVHPPSGACDGGALGTFVVPGACAVVDHAVSCSYAAGDPLVCGDFGTSCVGGACVARPAFCRLQWPETITAHASEPTTVFGRYYVAGVTDATPHYDADPFIVGDVGHGPWGTHPSTWSETSWIEATPNLGYDGRDFGGLEVHNDELMATLVAPDDGCRVAYAYRVSTDAGRTWTLCDLKIGDGADGSADGYQVDRAGALTVLPGPQAMRVTHLTIDDPLIATHLGPMASAIADGTLHLLLELRPFEDAGRVGSHLGELVDPGCDVAGAPCAWRVPASGLDEDTCRGAEGFDFVAAIGDETFTLEGGGAIGDRMDLGVITLWNARLEGVVGALDANGAIATAAGTLRGALRQDEVTLPRAPDTDTDGDGTLDACTVVLLFEARGGTIVGIAP